jgi:hypothetical protein
MPTDMDMKLIIIVVILLIVAAAGFAVKYYGQKHSPYRKKRYLNTFWNVRRTKTNKQDDKNDNS